MSPVEPYAPSPRSYGAATSFARAERVGVRGRRTRSASGETCTPSPGLHLAMQSHLSPQAGRGKTAFAVANEATREIDLTPPAAVRAASLPAADRRPPS